MDPECHCRCSYERVGEGFSREGGSHVTTEVSCCSGGFVDGRRGLKPKNAASDTGIGNETDSVPAPWREHGPDNLGLGAHETVSGFWPPEVEDSQFVPC